MQNQDWALVCHSNYGSKGTIAVVRPDKNGFSVAQLPMTQATGKTPAARPYFFGINGDGQAISMDPQSKTVVQSNELPADVFPAYAYLDPAHNRIWFVYDGDEDTGNDPVNCPNGGSSVTVVNRKTGKVLKTLCVGRGHHMTAFSAPSAQHPDVPKLAFVSDLLDGTMCIVGNDESNPDQFLKILKVINLCEPEKENGGQDCVPNNAFPHGILYATSQGKIFSLNNGYGTIVVIDPRTLEIENRYQLKHCSNLLGSAEGRFLVGKGADRKSNPDHVIGKLTVLDASSGDTVAHLDLQDFYPSVYRFSLDGKKLYLTSASTGKGTQFNNLQNTSVQVYDTSKLPAIQLQKTLQVGKASCGRRPIAFAHQGTQISHVFIPNPTDGTLSIFDGNDVLLDTVTIGEPNCEEVLFSFWGDNIYGA
ncbi:MAG: hypothetical protein OEW58_07965 [Gammaproteobacteria bacterium]|nr:hypothetical protein [Gammaproteobacteria bacterium]